MTWKTGPVGNEQRAVVYAGTDDVYAVAENTLAASKIVRALNDQGSQSRAAVQRDAIEALAQRLEEQWDFSRADVIAELRTTLRGEVPSETRGALVQVRLSPPAFSAHSAVSYSFVTRPGAGEVNVIPADYQGGTVEVTWV